MAALILRTLFTYAFLAKTQALLLRHTNPKQNTSLDELSHNSTIEFYENDVKQSSGQETAQAWTFPSYYDAHKTGRGIWKWSNSLVSYQRHFSLMAGKKLTIAEVGVQSGGSLEMWKAVLGAGCHVYGLDINPKCKQFSAPDTTIVIGDQGSQQMWDAFYQHVPQLDILVDDGSHMPDHMSLTLHNAFPRVNPGGYVAVEDIHGAHYVESFFVPAAQSIHWWTAQNLIASLHVYPYELFVHKTGGNKGNEFLAPAALTVDNFGAMWAAIPQNLGKTIAVQNPGWGSFLSNPSLPTIFREFVNLHDFNMHGVPKGCQHTPNPVCTAQITNSQAQNQVTGVHIFASMLIVEVAATPPNIQAVRRGDVFITYD